MNKKYFDILRIIPDPGRYLARIKLGILKKYNQHEDLSDLDFLLLRLYDCIPSLESIELFSDILFGHQPYCDLKWESARECPYLAIANLIAHTDFHRLSSIREAEYWLKLRKQKVDETTPSTLILSPNTMQSKQFKLGALTLLEGWAHSVTTFWTITSELMSSKQKQKFLDQFSGGIYSVAWTYFLENIKDYDLIRDKIPFHILCELSLWTPIHPVFANFWRKDLDWEDFHPGWRFAKACHVAGKIERPKMGEKGYIKYVNRICKELSWPSPTEMAEEALNVDPGKGFLSKYFQQCCKIRLARKDFFADPFLRINENQKGYPDICNFKELIPPAFLLSDNKGYANTDFFTVTQIHLANQIVDQLWKENGQFHAPIVSLPSEELNHDINQFIQRIGIVGLLKPFGIEESEIEYM